MRHARISMDEIPKVSFLGKDSVVLDVWYYCCAYVVYVVHVASMMCALVVFCIHNVCTCYLCNVMYKMVQIVLCEYCTCNAMYMMG